MGWVCPVCRATNSPMKLTCCVMSIDQYQALLVSDLQPAAPEFSTAPADLPAAAAPPAAEFSTATAAEKLAAPPAAADLQGVVGSKASKSSNPKPLRTQHIYTPAFERFWSAYPLHLGKFEAARRFEAAVAGGAAVDNLVAAAARYSTDPRRNPLHTKMAEGWLTGRRWEDEGPEQSPPVKATDWEALRAEEDARVREIRSEEEQEATDQEGQETG